MKNILLFFILSSSVFAMENSAPTEKKANNLSTIEVLNEDGTTETFEFDADKFGKNFQMQTQKKEEIASRQFAKLIEYGLDALIVIFLLVMYLKRKAKKSSDTHTASDS